MLVGETPRSIPAHAGEPGFGLTYTKPSGLSPRTRGSHTASGLHKVYLSPRTRGSRSPGGRPGRAGPGSIPAHAGEAGDSRALVLLTPRALGSIPAHAGEPTGPLCNRPRQPVPGLSPRTRGSRSQAGRAGGHRGNGLSPRTRGSRTGPSQTRDPPPGLSPRTRGSRQFARGRLNAEGSIPAHAGEPSGLMASAAAFTVYPRARGGALRRQ